MNLSPRQSDALVLAIELARSSQYENDRRQLLTLIGGAAALDELSALIATEADGIVTCPVHEAIYEVGASGVYCPGCAAASGREIPSST